MQQEDLDILELEQRNLKVKIELLNKNLQTIEEFEGNVLQDDYSIDADSDIRRVYNAIIAIDDDTFEIGRDKKIWIDKYLRVTIGIYDIRTKEYQWYFIGLYVMNTNNYFFDATNHTLSISCLDLVADLDGTRNGYVSGSALTIPSQVDDGGGNMVDNTIREAMIATVTQLGHIKEYRIENIKGTILTDNGYEILPNIPYDQQFKTGSSVWEIVKTLRDLYPGYETFFDEDRFICQPIPLYINDPIVMDAETLSKYYINEDTTVDFSGMYNVTEVWGQCLDADYFTDDVTNLSVPNFIYNLRYDSVSAIQNRTTFGFTANTNNLVNPYIQIQRFNTSLGIYESLGIFPLLGENNLPILADTIKAGKSYVIEYRTAGSQSNFYYCGEYQIVAVTKLVSSYPDVTKIQYDIEHEPTTNISYVVNPESPFCSDYEDVGEIRQILSDNIYSSINSEGLALQMAEYKNWQTTDLLDYITIEAVDIPWLDVNQKIEYYSNSLGKTQIYLIKSKKGSSTNGTMTVTMVKFQPIYSWLRS